MNIIVLANWMFLNHKPNTFIKVYLLQQKKFSPPLDILLFSQKYNFNILNEREEKEVKKYTLFLLVQYKTTMK